MFKLTIEDDEGKTTVVPVIRDEMTIGRDEGNTIRLTDRNVSRRHARLMRQNGSIYIEDLKSFTGVRVNGAKIAAATAVSESDQLQIGDYKIRLKSDRPVIEPLDRATRPTMAAVNGNGEATPGFVAVPVTPAPIRTPVAPQPSTSVTSMGRAVTPRPSPIRSVVDLLPAPDPIEAQPTIPLRMLSEMDPALGDASPIQEAPATPARLVVLTTELAGREFILDRVSLVIGRTNENDVVLNHRSISRHHAKIMQDRDHFTIVDLQSANGVRVNGEDYERIELHAGDVVELGHVRLRFVGPAEHFVFDPSSRAGRGRPSKVGLALAGVALAGAIGIIVQRTLGPRGDASTPGASTSVARSTPPVPSSPTAIAASPAQVTPPPTPGPSSEELLTQAAAQAKNDDWDGALATLEKLNQQAAAVVTAGEAGSDVRAQAAELRKRVDSERRNAIAFAKFDESFQQKNLAAAIDWYTEIPEESVYKPRAQPRFEETRAAFVAQHLLAAEKLRAAGRCGDLKQEIELIDKVDPNNAAARDKLRLCRPRPEGAVAINASATRLPVARAAAPPTAARQEPAASAAPFKRAPAAPSTGAVAVAPAAEGDGGDADALLKQARDAWLKQQCGAAIDLSRKAIRARPGMVDAYQVIAVCSCSLKDAEGATRAYAKLDDKSRNLVRTLCQRNGITVSAE